LPSPAKQNCDDHPNLNSNSVGHLVRVCGSDSDVGAAGSLDSLTKLAVGRIKLEPSCRLREAKIHRLSN